MWEKYFSIFPDNIFLTGLSIPTIFLPESKSKKQWFDASPCSAQFYQTPFNGCSTLFAAKYKAILNLYQSLGLILSFCWQISLPSMHFCFSLNFINIFIIKYKYILLFQGFFMENLLLLCSFIFLLTKE